MSYPHRATFGVLSLSFALSQSLFTAHAADKIDFAKEVWPVLQQNCIKCHGPEKQKAKLRLDSREAALKGGKDGPALVVGDAEKSDLYRRIILPKGNDDLMPPEGEPLTKSQSDIIKEWINQGAAWPENLAVAPAANKAPVLAR